MNFYAYTKISILLISDETSVHKYLSNLYESIVNRDIVGKTKSADKKAFMDISLYILAKAYLIHGVGRYNIVGKGALSNKEKQYAIDMGFRTINTNTINYEDTFFLENIIYNELITRGYTVFAGKTYKGEIEFGAYSKITDASPKYVMSLDKIDMSHDGIMHVNIIDFLLRKVDLILT